MSVWDDLCAARDDAKHDRARFKQAFLAAFADFAVALDDHDRSRIINELARKAPKLGCSMPEPELVELDGVRWIKLEGYGEMTPDDAEGLMFVLWHNIDKARRSK